MTTRFTIDDVKDPDRLERLLQQFDRMMNTATASRLSSDSQIQSLQGQVRSLSSLKRIVPSTGINVVQTPTETTIINTGAITVNGTTNQINAVLSAGTVTLSTPQNIDTAAVVQFGSLGLNVVAGAAGTLKMTGLETLYNNIATVSNGVPAEYATVDLTAQAAAITATTLYAVPASGIGMYRISFVAKVTTPATNSSTLGGGAGFQLIYTDADDSVVVTTPVEKYNSDATTLALNTTQAVYSGVIPVNAKASTNIQYQMGYTSSGVTAMQYNLHIKLEAL